MSFDKAKAMRNAERFVAQGRLRSAIDEYRAVVANDPRDIATLNMLGDLYAKNAEKREAVNCYMQVADYYGKQGFAQKAIAIYNKISRIQPETIEVSVKLAELHKVKGSLSEARSHYTTLAEYYSKQGKRLEALSMYKQIALLDPNNTDVCMNLADSYMRENQKDAALEAYAEAGARFSRQNRHEEAIRALMRGYDIKSTDLRILNGLVQAQSALGRATKAASLLEEIMENEPYNRDVLYLLIDCCIDSQNAPGAEKAVVKLVEIEPANYPKFLDLIRIYLNTNDPESAGRILTMSAEYLLAGGQSDECGKWINEILERDPNQLTGLRLLVRYNTWLNDETGVRLSLERLYNAAGSKDSVEDERDALKQLVVIRPHETRYRDRLNEINAEFGYADDEHISDTPSESEGDPGDKAKTIYDSGEEYILPTRQAESSNGNGHGAHSIIEGLERGGELLNAHIVEVSDSELSHSDKEKIQKELDSITFYIENDYNDLAVKAITELAASYGDRPEFAAMRKRIGAPEPINEGVEVEVEVAEEFVANTLGIDEIRSEFGLEENEEAGDVAGDYETHFQTAVAYQEMGLMEEAIREYQDAIDLVKPDDGTRRFFSCANLLGHCFLEHGRPNHAVTWFQRALETPKVSVEEYHGLWYELALAHQANGDEETATKFFEKVYAENVDFRDVAERVQTPVSK